MLIDHGEWGLCLYVVLSYPEARPKEGFSGRIESRECCRPTLFFYSRDTHRDTRRATKTKKGGAASARTQQAPPRVPRTP